MDSQAQTTRLLVVDDSPTDQATVAQMLHQPMLEQFGLPDSLGLETVMRFRAVAAEVPVVVLTGGDELSPTREQQLEMLQRAERQRLGNMFDNQE